MSNAKILSQKTVFEAELFQIDEYDLEKDGVFYRHRNVVERDVAMVIAINEKEELYLISQYRYLHGKDMLEGVAGFVENGLSPLETAKKELKEEAGLTAQKWTQLGTFERQASVIGGKIHIFIAQDLEESEQELEEFEEIQVLKMPLKEVINKIEKGDITVAGFIAAVLLLDRHLKGDSKV